MSPQRHEHTQQAGISYYDDARSRVTMSVAIIPAELVLDARADLGEGALWDAERRRLLWVDIMRGHVHEFDPETKTDRALEAGRPVGAVAPTVRGDWVLAAQGGFFRMNP